MSSLSLKIPPLAVLALAAGLMWLGARTTPSANVPLSARIVVSLGLAAVGLGTAIAGVVSFRQARTTVNPLRPNDASALVVSGIFRVTRNPMYLGMLLVLIAWAAFLANAVALMLVSTFVLYLNRFQIGPEENALAALFGSEFNVYRAKVRRWL